MRLFTLLSAAALACTSVIAHPVEHNDGHLEARQSNQKIVLLNQPANSVQTYPRLEIRKFRDQKPDQYTLLVLALQQMKRNTGQDGYFKISGIHGAPRENYNRILPCRSCGSADGYCPHGSVHFPAWHRAYLALFEQEFKKNADAIANSYPAGATRTRMQQASRELRLPFWDFAMRTEAGKQPLASVMTDERVTVNGPNGRVTIDNPLFRYDFTTPQRQSLLYGPFTTWEKTYRYPSSNTRTAVSQQRKAAAAYASARQNLQDQIYQLNDDASSSNAGCSNSLENIHNTIHNIIGGLEQNGVSGGHMSYLPSAAFDPIFWFLHCNVDRLLAMWQAINPNAYGASQRAPSATWTIVRGSTQTVNSNLTPFLKSTNPNVFWTTAQIRDTRVFKYSYPELINSDGSPNAVMGYVNRLYGPKTNAIAGSSKREAQPQIGENLDVLASDPLKAANGTLYQYVVNINTPRYALNGSYVVYCFNGKPTSEDATTWPTDPKMIGLMGVLAGPDMQAHNEISAGSIPLTRTLSSMVLNIGISILDNLSEAVVAPYLTKNLEWRIAQNGKSIDPSTIPGFVVTVVTSSAQHPKDANSFPIYSEFIELLDVTKGQAGGANTTQTTT